MTIRNRVYRDGQLVSEEIIDFATRTLTVEVGGVVESTRPLTAAENARIDEYIAEQQAAANKSTIDQAITAALAELDTLIAAPAVGAVPDGTLTNAQLSNALRSMREAVQQNRAGAQRVAATLKQTVRLVRGDFDGVG